MGLDWGPRTPKTSPLATPMWWISYGPIQSINCRRFYDVWYALWIFRMLTFCSSAVWWSPFRSRSGVFTSAPLSVSLCWSDQSQFGKLRLKYAYLVFQLMNVMLQDHTNIITNLFSLYTFCRAMHYSAKRGLAITCRLSVCDVGGSGPHRLKILETNCASN